MSVNASEEYKYVGLFGKPALFTNSPIDRTTVLESWSCKAATTTRLSL